MASGATMSRPNFSDRPLKRKKEQRTDIWSNLLRQTREAQARSRTQAVQHCELIVCGGSPDDQRSFAQTLSRPPPAQPPARNQERRQQKPKGELHLSNQYAYGYGHVTLYSPPQQSGTGVQVLGAEAEEVARVEVHTLPDAKDEYVGTLRSLLNKEKPGGEQQNGDAMVDGEAEMTEERRPGVCILLSWKEPWKFLQQLKRWLQLLAQALLQHGVPATDPLDVLKEAQLSITVVVQHTEAQEDLFREGYKEEDFDYISQCLRTAILPLHPYSALIYTTSTAPPQQPGGALSESQKVVFNSLGLDLAALSPKRPRSSSGTDPKGEELSPKHEFMDRMAIVIPAGWDSPAFIRTLSETFSPEEIVNGWLADLQPPPPPKPAPEPKSEESKSEVKQANGGAEVYENSPVDETEDFPEAPISPSKMPPSAVRTFESRVLDPQAHKAPKPPQIEVKTKPDQKFLAEMREHLQQLETQDREREAKGHHSGVSNTSLSSGHGRVAGVPSGDSTGALNDLGDVSFNVGGVSYDTVTAQAAIERLKRPPQSSAHLDSPLSPTPRTSTPKPPGRGHRDASGEDRHASTPSTKDSLASSKSPESKEPLPIDKLEEYFQSLMNPKGASSRDNTPTKGRGASD